MGELRGNGKLRGKKDAGCRVSIERLDSIQIRMPSQT